MKHVERWSGAPADAFLGSNSVKYLTSTGQIDDLDYVLGHVDDVDAVFALDDGEITMLATSGGLSENPRMAD
jgi:hypothetical protein